jgi:hypothetical protein
MAIYPLNALGRGFVAAARFSFLVRVAMYVDYLSRSNLIPQDAVKEFVQNSRTKSGK